jgi:hypothetical protein
MAITKVSSGVISANAVTATIVAENVITSSEIATDGVGTLQIADDAVTSAKLDTNIDIAGTLDVTGVLTADSNVVIAGNLTVNGSTVTNSSTNTTIEDALIELGTGTTGTPANDAGIIIERGDSNNAFMGFDESADKFIVATTTATGSSTGDLTLTAAPLVTGALTASGLSYPTSDGSANQVIKTDGSGNLSFVTAITDGAVVHNYTATGDGSTVTFDTGINPQDEVNTWVHIDGVYQNKSEYSYNGSEITFTTAPDSGAAIDIITGNQNGFSTADSVLGVYSTTTTDTDTYDTGLSATNENNVNIFIEGVYQPKSTYTWSGSTITFDANTPTGLALEVIASKTLTSGAVVTGSITDSAVTTAKIANNAITSAKIVNNSITGADISATTDIVANTFTGALTGNVTGNVTGNLTGTIQTAAQTNITSVGTLTGLTTSGNVNITGNIDASGLLKVGTNDSEYANNYIRFKPTGAAYIDHNTTGQDINFRVSNSSSLDTTPLTVTSSGITATGLTVGSDSDITVDIGRAKIGDVGFSDFAGFAHRDNASTGSYALLQYSTGETYLNAASGRDLNFRINNSNVGMFTSDGNLLVGTTDTDLGFTDGDDGVVFSPSGYIQAARDSAFASLYLNKLNNDGSLVNFAKDGSTVGSIGTQGSSTYIAGASSGLRFAATNIMPVNSSGTFTDNTSDLGGSTERFKDLYLSGGVNFSANSNASGMTSETLDDYEEGTWTPTSGFNLTINSTCRYTKIGSSVTLTFDITFATGTDGNYGKISGLPFSSYDYSAGMIGYDTASNRVTMSYSTGSDIYFLNATTNAYFSLTDMSGIRLIGAITYLTAN